LALMAQRAPAAGVQERSGEMSDDELARRCSAERARGKSFHEIYREVLAGSPLIEGPFVLDISQNMQYEIPLSAGGRLVFNEDKGWYRAFP
jgi:hypothetical protein